VEFDKHERRVIVNFDNNEEGKMGRVFITDNDQVYVTIRNENEGVVCNQILCDVVPAAVNS
jgi:hypothetical protein